MLLKIAILGKTNVGKSTLFNKLCNKNIAIVDSRAGTTRDRKIFEAKLYDLDLLLIDTAGWEDLRRWNSLEHPEHHNESVEGQGGDTRPARRAEIDDALEPLMLRQTLSAAEDADLLLFVVDGRGCINKLDLDFAERIRALGKPTILVVNKSEGKLRLDDNEVYQLGFGEPLYISAMHNIGFGELYARLAEQRELNLANQQKKNAELALAAEKNRDRGDEKNAKTPIVQVAIVGRPNVGKSTLFNAIYGDNRMITNALAGTTRDSVTEQVALGDLNFDLIDTAGMRRRGKIKEDVEYNSIGQSITAIRRANVVLLVMSAEHAFENQDISIARVAINEGKALIIVINKIDLVQNLEEFTENIHNYLEEYLGDMKTSPVLYISALYKPNLSQLAEYVRKSHATWNKACSTSALNQWLQQAVIRHAPPLSSTTKQKIRLKYIAQVASRPPTFQLFVNRPEDLPGSYINYLRSSLLQQFDFAGIPIRLQLKKQYNPYVSGDRPQKSEDNFKRNDKKPLYKNGDKQKNGAYPRSGKSEAIGADPMNKHHNDDVKSAVAGRKSRGAAAGAEISSFKRGDEVGSAGGASRRDFRPPQQRTQRNNSRDQERNMDRYEARAHTSMQRDESKTERPYKKDKPSGASRAFAKPRSARSAAGGAGKTRFSRSPGPAKAKAAPRRYVKNG